MELITEELKGEITQMIADAIKEAVILSEIPQGKLLSGKDVCKLFRIAPRVLTVLIRDHGLPCKRLGRTIVVDRFELEEWFKNTPDIPVVVRTNR